MDNQQQPAQSGQPQQLEQPAQQATSQVTQTPTEQLAQVGQPIQPQTVQVSGWEQPQRDTKRQKQLAYASVVGSFMIFIFGISLYTIFIVCMIGIALGGWAGLTGTRLKPKSKMLIITGYIAMGLNALLAFFVIFATS